jgi:DNA repair protein RadD
MISLRHYQHRVIYDELLPWFETHPEGHPIVSACVGSGKSIMIAELCRHAVTAYEGYRSRILMLVPSKELLEQNAAKLTAIAPDLRIGIVSASAGRKDVAFDKDVVVATVGSVIRNPGNLGRLDLIMVDECHLVARKDTGQYRELIAACQRFNPALRVIGWTGTPFRGNGVWLTEGEERLFTDIAARVSMPELLAEGYLSPLVPGVTKIQVSGNDIAVDAKTGDYKINALAEKLDQKELTAQIAEEICNLGADRKKWLVFGVTVSHADHLAWALRNLGISAALVHGKTPDKERDRLIKDFRSGYYRALVNVAVLTTGFDVPDVDLIALVRNTKSPVLYTQIAGRGMRIADGKADCLWLDFTDATMTLGPVDKIKGRAEPKRDGESGAPFKICDDCGASNPTGAAACAQCGFEFPAPKRIMHSQANGADILSGAHFGYKELPVVKVTYHSHQKKGTDDVFILRVNYWSGMRVACSEWICLEHTGYARAKAEKWWKERFTGKFDLPVPNNVVEALYMTDWLKTPSRILVKYGGKYPEFIRAIFEEQVAA